MKHSNVTETKNMAQKVLHLRGYGAPVIRTRQRRPMYIRNLKFSAMQLLYTYLLTIKIFYRDRCCSMLVRRFKTSDDGQFIQVELDDEIDFVCPFYSQSPNDASGLSSFDESRLEYYIVYQVRAAYLRFRSIISFKNVSPNGWYYFN